MKILQQTTKTLQMKKFNYFWSNFEEQSTVISNSKSNHEKTHTRQREEQDQRRSVIASGTNTMTATREEIDQDANNIGHEAIPRSVPSSRMKTLTETREEPDQDFSCQSYCAFRCKS